MARIELKATPVGVFIDRLGRPRPDVPFTLTGGTLYSGQTGTDALPSSSFRTNRDGEGPGWLEPGVYTITDQTTNESATFEVGGFAGQEALEGRVTTLESTADPAASPPGAVVRTAAPFITGRYRLRDKWYAGDFGARFNGNEETTALQDAIRETRLAGRTLWLPDGVSAANATLTRTADNALPLTIRGAGKNRTVIEHGAASTALLSQLGSIGSAVALTAAVTKGTNVLTVASTSGIVKDDIILVRDTTQTYLGNSDATPAACFSDVAQVRSVDSATQLTLYERLDHSYTTSGDYRKITLTNGITIADLTIRGTASNGIGARAVTAVYARNIELFNVLFQDLRDDAMRFQTCIDFTVRDCTGINLRDLELEGNPYFINLANACSHGLISGCMNRYGRHLVTAVGSLVDGAPNHVHVSDCIAVGFSQTAFDTHPGSRRFTFADCVAHNLLPDAARSVFGFQIRGPDSAIFNPIVTQADVGVAFMDGADRGVVQGGRISDCTRGVYNRASVDLKVKGVRMERVTDAGVDIEARAGFPTLTGLSVEDCYVDAPTPFRFGTWDDSFRIRDIETPAMARRSLDRSATLPSGARAETLDRRDVVTSTLAPFTSGTLHMTTVQLEAGWRITKAGLLIAADAASPTNLWYALYDRDRNLLGVTNDHGSGTTTAGAVRELTFSTPIVVKYTGQHYLGIVSVATTPHQVRGHTISSNVSGIVPIMVGNSSTGLTNPASAPSTAAALTVTGIIPYAYIV